MKSKQFVFVLLAATLICSLFSGCVSSQKRFEQAVAALDQGDFAQAEKLLERIKDIPDAEPLKKKMVSPMKGISNGMYYYASALAREYADENYRQYLGDTLFQTFEDNYTDSSLAGIAAAVQKAPLVKTELKRIKALEPYVQTETDALYYKALEVYWKLLCDQAFDEATERQSGENTALCGTNFRVIAGILGVNITLNDSVKSLSFMLTSLDELNLTQLQLDTLEVMYTIFAEIEK